MWNSVALPALRFACWAAAVSLAFGATASAATTHFFDASQVATLVNEGVTWDTISSQGFLFTYTRDKLFTGGIGLTEPIGRPVRVPWPQGVEAQGVTAGPNPSGAKITVERVDGRNFDFTAFTAKLLANTAGTGASFEIMPRLNGEDAWNDPLFFDASGYAGSTFSYDESGGYWGNTLPLKGFEAYSISLFVDFALTALTLQTPGLPELVGDANGDCTVGAADYALWAAQFGQQGPALTADFDQNGSVGAGDYALWAANFGATCPAAGAATVPEPATRSLLLVASTLAAGLRGRKRSIAGRA